MKIVNNGSAAECRGSVIAIGNFDGVHLGHQAVVEKAARLAEGSGAPLAAMVFEPHPRAFFRPDRPLFRLTPLDVKAHLMHALGVEFLVVMDFDADLAALPARDFVSDILADRLAVRHIVIGYDFRFGKQRQGDAALLRAMSAGLNFDVSVVEPVTVGTGAETPYSSSQIRSLLHEGRPRPAAELLGYWWCLIGEVVEGDHRGRTIGFPTANIRMPGEEHPLFGVYTVRARTIDDDGPGEAWAGVANLGRRPTFDRQDVLLEVHLLDYSGDLYGRKLLVEFIEFLRPERKFGGIEELTAQIAADAEAARSHHRRLAEEGDPMERFVLGRRFAPAARDTMGNPG